MAKNIPIYIPTYIGDQNYNPSRVLPRLLFFNGTLECQNYYLQGITGSQAVGFPVTSVGLTNFPYFDNYSAETGSFPTTGSKSLLFYNEDSVYGQVPTASLYSEYWEDYVSLLYNPRTRLLNATAIIPLADYFNIELNDIVEFRGEYWHLRYINDYNLKNGECVVQLLGPIFPAAVPFSQPVVPNYCIYDGFTIVCNPTTTTTTSTTTTTTETPTTTTTTTIAPPEPDVYVYAKYVNSAPSGNLVYSINGGFPITIGPISTTSCLYVTNITGLSIGDTVTFSNSNTFAVAGAVDTGCPDTVTGCTFNYNPTGGTEYVYLTIDGNNAC